MSETGHGHGIFSAQLLALISNASKREKKETPKGSRPARFPFVSHAFLLFINSQSHSPLRRLKYTVYPVDLAKGYAIASSARLLLLFL